MYKRTRPGLPVPYLREWREKAVLGQNELAEKAGVNPTTVWNIEQGYIARFDTIGKLAQALGVTRQQLMYELPPERIEASAP